MSDSESVTTISELNSVFGGAELTTIVSQKDEEIRLLREQIARMNSEKLEQSVPPSWITKETEAVEKCLDEFRVAFNDTKQCILDKRGNEDLSEDYQERKKAARLTEELNEVWMSAARDVKIHLNEITAKLANCCGKLEPKIEPKEVAASQPIEGELWMNVRLPNIEFECFPKLQPSHILQHLDADAVKVCKKLVGVWTVETSIPSIPTKLDISFHISGFVLVDPYYGVTIFGTSCYRPDGKLYLVNGQHIKCIRNGDSEIACTFYDSQNLLSCETRYRYLNDNTIDHTIISKSSNPSNGTFKYIKVNDVLDV